MELLSFFGQIIQKLKVSCFSDSFVQKTTQQSDGSCNVTSDSQLLWKLFEKQSVFSANRYENYIVSTKNCIPRQNDKLCFLPNCRYHIMLRGDINDLLQSLDVFCFNYQHIDCLYTLFKYRFSGKIVVKRGQLFDNTQGAVHFKHQNRGVDRMPSIAKKRLLRKKYKKHLLSSVQKTKLTQTSESVFGDRFEQGKNN